MDWRWCVGLLLGALNLCSPLKAAELTGIERQWLAAALPVLRYAVDQHLPIDIIVQPQPAPGETPMGTAYIDGRCKLVLSMRGNPEVAEVLSGVPPALLEPVLESMAAHELGHCWRHVEHRWGQLPPGLQPVPLVPGLTPEQAGLIGELWTSRREEAFADLVALAWTRRQYPERYHHIHAWYLQLRAERALATGPHDTRQWVQLADEPARFASTGSIFEQAEPLWFEGLRMQVEERLERPPAPAAVVAVSDPEAGPGKQPRR